MQLDKRKALPFKPRLLGNGASKRSVESCSRFAWRIRGKVAWGSSNTMNETFRQPSYRNSRVLRWASYLWREAIFDNGRPIAPAFTKPNPAQWSDEF